jgi:tripartite ATP-independent transporter DctP family solute receptor
MAASARSMHDGAGSTPSSPHHLRTPPEAETSSITPVYEIDDSHRNIRKFDDRNDFVRHPQEANRPQSLCEDVTRSSECNPRTSDNHPRRLVVAALLRAQKMEGKVNTISVAKWVTVAAAAVVLSLAPAAAAPKVIRAGHGVPEAHYEHKAMLEFKRVVEEKSGGSLKVELYPNAMLGSDMEVLDSIRLGTAQMNIPTPSVLGNFVKEFRLADLPFLYPNEDVANRVAEGPWTKKLMKKLEPVGFVGLAVGNFGFRQISNNVRPINTIKDLQGLKIRVMQNTVILDVFRALGANPTPMAFGEVFSALQTGTIDGQENPYANTYQPRFHEVQKYISNSSHMYSWGILVIGKKFYDGLTDKERAIINEAGQTFAVAMRKFSKEDEAAALEKIIKAGNVYTAMTPEARKQMQEAAAPVIEKHGNSVSPEMFKELKEEIAKYSKM